MDIYEIPLRTLEGEPLDLRTVAPRGALIVNVASFCGLTPQYAALQQLHERFAPDGIAVIGAPCNQFGQQEPGTADEIASLCETAYGVTFPLLEKLEVNGDGRHPLYRELVETPDADGDAGDVQWNFEKFVVAGTGRPVARFRPQTTPDDPAVVSALQRL